MNYWLKWLLINVAALVLATLIGLLVLSQVYVLKLNVRHNPASPLVLGFIVSVAVAIAAPATRFMPRFIVLSAIFAGEYLLSFAVSNVTLFMANAYWDGDVGAEKPWIYGGAIIPLVTGVTGYLALRRYRLSNVADVFR
ncbi:MAG: hypothetical protein E5X80_09280 [Mesorhizobium sp.]|uniref:hypothetical protein n=1 Tax=Mesorhizobium sp. TaxID=1871066 RepID=UPI001217234A|nr:hypothetical protein [Mesorhizobium sp.]TIO51294.1 MAG: hypothetical protein E5X78_17465 [Mesorhizobium sp.]TIO59197.1 MAG: hypothetical protein E5X79_18210 [Mesorhizobium sp.]TJV65781.1 MAG: hypothetical protein E5X80_09280 [Mesorhizobium sp.]